MRQHPDFPSETKEETIRLLNDRPRTLTLAKIAEATGLSTNWLTMFGRGRITHAGIGRVEALNRFLKNLD